MTRKASFHSKKSLHPVSRYPLIELLEDRCVPAGLPIPLPPGQSIFQYANSVLQNLEAYRVQADNSINAVETQQINQLGQNLSTADQIAQTLIAQVSQDREQFNTDIANGASLQTQIADLAKIQVDGQAVGAGVGLIAQYKQVAIQQTIQQLQVDEQLRFAINQMINQQENGLLSQILPAIVAAEQAINAAGPQVGSPLTAGQSATYSGVVTTTINQPGFMMTTTANITLTVTIGSNGVSFTGPESATVTSVNDFTNIPTTMSSTSGAINGSLVAPNGTAATGSFSLTFASGTQSGTLTGFLGSSLFVGQTTDLTSGVSTPFTLQRVQ